MTAGIGTPLAAGSILGLTAADGAYAAPLAVLGLLLAWHGVRVYSGRVRVPPRRGRVFLYRPDIDLSAAWCGSGLALWGIGWLLSIPPSLPVDIIGQILAWAGAVVFLFGLVSYVYLPRRLRPAWAGAGAGPAVQSPAAQAPSDRLRLVHHHLAGNLRTSEEEVRDLMGLIRPRLLVPGTISGPLPYGTGVSRTPRKGALWVMPGRILFVQSAEDDRRLDETYFVEIPADKLDAMRAGQPHGRQSVLAMDIGQGAMSFTYDGDAEALRRDILEVLAA